MARQCLIFLFLVSFGEPLLGAREIPLLDLPSELVMDVNKPYAISSDGVVECGACFFVDSVHTQL